MTRSSLKLITVLCCFVFTGGATLASEPTVESEPSNQSRPAVDGVNGKLSFGGSGGDLEGFGVSASVSMPLGHRFGFQLDGAFAEVDTRLYEDISVYAVGAHLFWRDPDKGLLGLYGDTTHIDVPGGISLFTLAVEGALYLERFTIDGVAGIEGGEAVDTGFQSHIHLNYYPTDNVSLRIGHAYAFDRNGFALGGEWALGASNGVTPSLYAVGIANQDDRRTVVAGMKFYFGQQDKTLIRIHREADPKTYVAQDYEHQGSDYDPYIEPTLTPTLKPTR